MADPAKLSVPVRVTPLMDVLLIEIAPESPKGVTFAVPMPGEESKAPA